MSEPNLIKLRERREDILSAVKLLNHAISRGAEAGLLVVTGLRGAGSLVDVQITSPVKLAEKTFIWRYVPRQAILDTLAHSGIRHKLGANLWKWKKSELVPECEKLLTGPQAALFHAELTKWCAVANGSYRPPEVAA